MTIYNKQIEYIKTNWRDEKTIKSSEIKKIKLENQGYNHVKSWIEYGDISISKYERGKQWVKK